jgi:dipeptide transport system ATP-binding protein
MPPLLKVQHLSRYYQVSRGLFRQKATVKALHHVSFSLRQASTLAVVGESGCGKSTLARQLTFIETPSAGQVEIHGALVNYHNQAQLKTLRKTVQMVFQNPYASLNPRKRIGTLLEEPLQINTHLTAIARQEQVLAMMDKVGLRQEHYHRYPHMFSGGQRQRIAIARAMILQPEIVVADEPVSALDVSIQAQILNLFMDLQEELKISYVFISHNLSVVEHIADEVLVMYFGSTVEYGDKHLIYQRPLHPYTQALMSATPTLNPNEQKTRIKLQGELPSPLTQPTGCSFHLRCPYATTHCVEVTPLLRPLEGRQIACHRAEEIN